MSDLKHMHAKTECLPFNTEDVRLVITERYGKQEIRMHGEDARFIVEAIAAAKRSSQPEAVDGDPIGDLQAEARQAKLDDFIASMKNQPEATAQAQDLSAAILGIRFNADYSDPKLQAAFDRGCDEALVAAAALASSANTLSEVNRVDAIADAARSVLREALDAARVHPCDSNNDNARAKQLSPLMQRLYRAILQYQKGGSHG